VTDRILPQEEWERLDGTEIAEALPYLKPSDVQIVVVEDGERIVAAWAVLRPVQLEGVWIAEDYRKRGMVAGRLLAATMAVARATGAQWAYTGATTQEVANLLTKHLDAVKYPADTYLVPLTENVPCR